MAPPIPTRIPRHDVSSLTVPRARMEEASPGGTGTGAVFSNIAGRNTAASSPVAEGGLAEGTNPDGRAGPSAGTGTGAAAASAAAPIQASQSPDTELAQQTPEDASSAETASAGEGEVQAGIPAAPATTAHHQSAPESTTQAPADPPPVILPYVAPVDLNAIRSPIVRAPPMRAQIKAEKILQDTGTSPSQHHANIQTAVLRVSETTRKAQRDLVQGVDSIALNTRWSIEQMADGIDAVVDRCVATVNSAARSALRDIEAAVILHEGAIAGAGTLGAETLKQNRETVSTQIVENLNDNGSEVMQAAHLALVRKYEAQAVLAGPRVLGLSDGLRPELLRTQAGETRDVEWEPLKDRHPTFQASADAIAAGLHPVPRGGGQSYYTAFIDRGKAQALPHLKTDVEERWQKGAEDRVKELTSVTNKNRFIIASLGLVAPTREAMEKDETRYGPTLDIAIREQYGDIDQANVQAIKQMRRTRDGVRNFFDPAHPKSAPFTATKGLRENGAKLKVSMYDQARVLQASLRSSVAGMASSYPDLIVRVEGMLQGDDLMHDSKMLPRIAGVSDSAQALLQGHLGMIRSQARDALGQTRKGYSLQVKGMWESVGKTVESFGEQKQNALFHFAMEEGLFKGEFEGGLEAATDAVRGYAERTANQLMRPIQAGAEAGGRIEVLAVDHFNSVLANEYKSHMEAVATFPEQIGVGAPANPEATEAFPKIEGMRRTKLSENAFNLMQAVPEPKTREVAASLGVSIVAAPFSGGLSLAAGGLGLYYALSSVPDVDDAATALAMPWPGALAMDAMWDSFSDVTRPRGRERIAEQVSPLANPNWRKLLGLYSSSEATAAAAKSDLITDAAWPWGINDDSVAAIAQSFSPTELALLSDTEINAMSASVKANLSGSQLDITQAYIDGNPARAAAVRIEEALTEARRKGEMDMRGFTATMDNLIKAEMENASTAGFVSPSMTQQLTDQMYVELAARIPEPGEGRSVSLTGDAAPGAVSEAASVAPTRRLVGPMTQAQSFQESANSVAGVRADPNAVTRAKERFIAHATRDYVQFETNYSLLFEGGEDDWLAADLARLQGNTGADGRKLADGRRAQNGLIFDRMNSDTRAMIAAYVNKGPSSPEYQEARTMVALNGAGSGYWDTSEAELISVLRETENQQLYQAEDKLARLMATPDADPAKLAEARAARDAAQVAQDQRIMRLALRIGGPETGDALTPAVAKARVANRINVIAADFDPALGGIGEEVLSTGRINLADGMNVATGGLGTHDDLLMHVTGNRTQRDLARFRIDAAGLGATRPEDRDWFAETSSDQAQQLEINLRGIPENDADRMELADIRARHEAHDGTGLVADITMATSWQKAQMEHSHAAIGNRAKQALDAFNAENPGVLDADVAGLSAEQLFPLGGPMHPVIAGRLLNEDGNLIGDGPTIGMLAAQSRLANTAYRQEIARQEAFFTAGITALTVAASILLLFIPGVNVVAAGILVALIGGAATIAVKAGMRGNRYGWEEAAVDVAKTGIEAAMGGVGGAMGGAVKAGTPGLNLISKVGGRINGAFEALTVGLGRTGRMMGTAGAAAVREGVTSATSGVANAALDDRIWSKGTGHGLETLLSAGTRGAVTGALSGGVSEIAGGLSKTALGPGLPDGEDVSRLSRLGDRLGPAGREALEEAVSGAAGALSSEAANILFDLSEGKTKLNLAQFAARLGKAGLKDFLTGGLKSGIKSQFKQTYLAQRSRMMRSGETPTPEQVKFMRKLAISAGMEQYGGGAKGAGEFAKELNAAQVLFRQLPPDLQKHAGGMSAAHVQAVAALRDGGPDAVEGDVKSLSAELAKSYPDLDVRSLFNSIGQVRRQDRQAAHLRRMAAQKRQGVATRTRKQILAGLEPAVRRELADMPVGEISKLPVALQREIAQLVAQGGDDIALARLVSEAEGQGASARTPVDGPTLRHQLEGLMSARPVAEAAATQKAAARRADLRRILPPELAQTLGRLSDKDAGFLHRVLMAERVPSRQTLGHIEQMMARHLDAEGASNLVLNLIAANTKAASARNTKAVEARAARAPMLTHVPQEQRAVLSHLVETDLLAIAFAQAGTVPLTQTQITAMIKTARATAPDLNDIALRAAIDATIKAPSRKRPFFERFAQRRALISFVPKHLRSLVRRTPVLSVPDHMFAAYVKTHDGTASIEDNAVTLRLNGEVVVVVRDGAPGHVLREEGYHVLQMRHPTWAARLSQLDEATLQSWPILPAARKLELARIAIDAEIDAHHAMLAGLDLKANRAFFGRKRRRLANETDLAEARLAALMRRAGEMEAISPTMLRAMDAGIIDTPAFLAQPARLFSNTEGQTQIAEETPLDARKATLEKVLDEMAERIAAKRPDAQTQAFTTEMGIQLEAAKTLAHVEALTAVAGRYSAIMEHTRNGSQTAKAFGDGLTTSLALILKMKDPTLLKTMAQLMTGKPVVAEDGTKSKGFSDAEVMSVMARLQSIEGIDAIVGDGPKGRAVATMITLALAERGFQKLYGPRRRGSVLTDTHVAMIRAIGGNSLMDRGQLNALSEALLQHFTAPGQRKALATSQGRAALTAALESLQDVAARSQTTVFLNNIATPQLLGFIDGTGQVPAARRADLAAKLQVPLGAGLPSAGAEMSHHFTDAIAHARSRTAEGATQLDTAINAIVDADLASGIQNAAAHPASKQARVTALKAVAQSLAAAFETADFAVTRADENGVTGDTQVQISDIAGLLYFVNDMLHGKAVAQDLAGDVGLTPLEARHFTQLIDYAKNDSAQKPSDIFTSLSVIYDHITSGSGEFSRRYFRALHSSAHPNQNRALDVVRLNADGGASSADRQTISTGARAFQETATEADLTAVRLLTTLGTKAQSLFEKIVKQRLDTASDETDLHRLQSETITRTRKDEEGTQEAHDFVLKVATTRRSDIGTTMAGTSRIAEQILDDKFQLIDSETSRLVLLRLMKGDDSVYTEIAYQMQGSGDKDRSLSVFMALNVVAQMQKKSIVLGLSSHESYPAMAKKLFKAISELPNMRPQDVNAFERMIKILAFDDVIGTVDIPTATKDMTDDQKAEIAQQVAAAQNVDAILHLVTHIMAGSETTRDTKSLGVLLVALGLGTHLRAHGTDQGDLGDWSTPMSHIFGHERYRRLHVNPLLKLRKDGGFSFRSKDRHAAYNKGIAAFLDPNVERAIQASSGLASFTQVKYMDYKGDVADVLAMQASDRAQGLADLAPAAHSIIKRDAELVRMANEVVDLVYPFPAEELAGRTVAEVQEMKLRRFVDITADLLKVENKGELWE